MPTPPSHEPGPAADLLQPLDDASPCGPDLEYDPGFVVLLANVATRSDAQYGDFVETATPVNWAEAERDCRALLARSKDLRLLVILARCRVRQDGAAGLRTSLELIDAMLHRFGAALNPVPVIEGENDPLVVSNALGGLADPDGLVADVRDIAMPKSLGSSLQLRDIERALAKTRLKDALAPDAAMRLVTDLLGRRDATALGLSAAASALKGISAWTSEHLGAVAPDLGLLMRLLEPFHAPAASHQAPPAAARPEAETASSDVPPGTVPADTPPPHADPASASTRSRWDVLETLRSARLWFETHEPSSPVSVLLRQAERMIGKRYAELHRMMPAELLEQWDSSQDCKERIQT